MVTIEQKRFTVSMYGENAIRLIPEISIDNELAKIGECILMAALDNILDVIASQHEIVIKLNDKIQLEETLLQISKIHIHSSEPTTYHLPVYFDIEKLGQDFPDDFIPQLCNLNLSVAMFGFIPGFIYLNGLPKQYHLPRKKTPDINCRKGSIAIGGEYLGIYNLSSPAGWNIIGQTPIDIPIYKQEKLRISDTINLHQIDKNGYADLIQQGIDLFQYND